MMCIDEGPVNPMYFREATSYYSLKENKDWWGEKK